VGESFRFARELCGAPFVVSFHGYDFSTVPRKEGADVYRKLFAAADAITVNSNYTSSRVESLGCPCEKLRLLPVGLDPAEFAFRPRSRVGGEPLRLLTVARLVEIKGHEFVIRALPFLRNLRIPVHYDIVGDGPLRKNLEKTASELGFVSSVRFHGSQSAEVTKALMAQAHVFVLASVSVEGDREGQGLALQEAQACGLPVVAKRHGAFPEGVLDGESGFLVSERNSEALAERLQFLYSRPQQWAKMGEAGREFVVQKYDIHKLNRQLVDLYRETIVKSQ
jgi:colanic acid/amylovoran biosynthesis glycosyltransferase